MYEIQKQGKSKLLDFFNFRKYRTYHSRDLETSLSILRISQILVFDEEYYKLSKIGKEYIENKILQKFTESEKEELKKMSKDLEKLIKILEV